MKNFFIFLLISFGCFLFGNDFVILYNKPKIQTNYHYHILQKERPEKIYSLKNFYISNYLTSLKFPMFVFKTDSLYINFNYKLGISYEKSPELYYHSYFYGATLKGNIKNRFLFYSDWWKIQFSRRVETIHSPLQDCWNEEKSIDNSNTIVKYLGNFYDFSFGRSKFQVGSGISGSVILSDVCDDYGFLSANFNLKDFHFSFMHASLVPDSMNIDYLANPSNSRLKKYDDKFLALHKVDYRKYNLHLFVGEMVVYGSRSFDLNYTLPFAFWRAIEHDNGDRDNMLMFFGLDWEINDKNILYFNFNLDDLFKSKLFTSFWGNKYAIQLGYRRFLSKNLIFTNEFVAVRPWTYTHKKLVNVFSNYRKPLGFPDGSNLIENSSEFDFNFFRKLDLVLKYSLIKQGSVGNNFAMNYLQVGDQRTARAKWLDGTINTINKLFISIDYSFLNVNKIHTALEFKKDKYESFTRISLQYQIQF